MTRMAQLQAALVTACTESECLRQSALDNEADLKLLDKMVGRVTSESQRTTAALAESEVTTFLDCATCRAFVAKRPFSACVANTG